MIEHDRAQSSVIERIERTYPEPVHLKLASNVYLLTGDFLIDHLMDALGFKGEAADAVGLVMRLNGTYSGRTYQSVWDWMARATAPA